MSTWPIQASSISELSQVPNCRTAPVLSLVLDHFETVSGVILLWRSGDPLGPFFRPWASTAKLLNRLGRGRACQRHLTLRFHNGVANPFASSLSDGASIAT